MKRPGIFSLLTLLGMAAAGYEPLGAAERPPKKKDPAAASAGWRAFRDPATGKLREPTPEEARELSRRDAQKSAAPTAFEVVVHPDGMKSVDLKGAFTMSLAARRNPDGSISYECRSGNGTEK
jgi:hypothetical protein